MGLQRFLSALPGIAWPGFPGQAAAQKLALLFEIEQQEWRPAEEIAAAQFEQVQQVLTFAAGTGGARETLRRGALSQGLCGNGIRRGRGGATARE